MMETSTAIHGRRSIRNFSGKSLSRETIEGLIGDAVMAPSAMDSRPWAFFVVQDKTALSTINREAKRLMLGAMGERPYLRRYEKSFESEKFDLFYGADALLGICAKPSGPNAAGDCHLAAQNLMLSAWDKGIGSCVIGLSSLYLNTSEAKRRLGVPDDYSVVVPIALGRCDETPTPSKRRQAEILSWR
jgi:nitroreductase